MARSIETIYNEIIAAKEAESGLDALDSTSATAIWRLWAYVIATVMFTLETLWDLFKGEIEGIFATQRPGTLLWYRATCLAFRYGVGLVVNNGRIGYPVDNTTPPLLAQCSVREAADGLVIKIAKDVSGELQPLSTEESNSFNSFISSVKYAGTQIRVVNSPANLLKLQLTIYYDPLIFKPNGERISDSARAVDHAIGSYLRFLPFDGRLKITSLIDKIMNVDGVQDCHVALIAHKYENYQYEPIQVSHIPESGYFKIDSTFPLSSTLTFEPHV